MRVHAFVPLLAVCAGLSLGACKGAGQHCTSADGATCTEWSGGAKLGILGAGTSLTYSALCAAIGADPAPGACPDAGKVGGCASDDGTFEATTWTYEGTLDDVTCSSDETLLDADGAPIEAIVDTTPPPTCSVDGGAAVAVTFENASARTVSLYWVDQGCGETLYASLVPGATHDQPTYVGHAWRLRAGDADPTGEVLWDGVVGEAGTITYP